MDSFDEIHGKRAVCFVEVLAVAVEDEELEMTTCSVHWFGSKQRTFSADGQVMLICMNPGSSDFWGNLIEPCN